MQRQWVLVELVILMMSPPAPIDNINTNNHIGDTTLFGKRVTGKNVRRLIRRVDWTQGTRYEMYRHDYSINSRFTNNKICKII